VNLSKCSSGGLSYQGQRCTAVKVVMVQDSIADALVDKAKAAVDKLSVGDADDDCDICHVISSSSADYIESLVKGVHLRHVVLPCACGTMRTMHRLPTRGCQWGNMSSAVVNCQRQAQNCTLKQKGATARTQPRGVFLVILGLCYKLPLLCGLLLDILQWTEAESLLIAPYTQLGIHCV
jgi:Aldehyde dehydrogenase family